MSDLQVAEIKHTHWDADVYEPSDDTFLLVDVLQQHARSWEANPPLCCVELGSGSGYVITSLALLLRQLVPPALPRALCDPPGAAAAAAAAAAEPCSPRTGPRRRCRCQLLAVDHSPAAVQATAATLQAHEVTEVDVVAASLLGPLEERLRGAVDVLVFNPPYVPTPDEEVDDRGGIASAWAGGHRGRRVIDRVLPLLSPLLSPRGELFMVTVAENDPQGIIEEMRPLGFQGRIAARRQADEETLQIVHLWRGGGAAAAGQPDNGDFRV